MAASVSQGSLVPGGQNPTGLGGPSQPRPPYGHGLSLSLAPCRLRQSSRPRERESLAPWDRRCILPSQAILGRVQKSPGL